MLPVVGKCALEYVCQNNVMIKLILLELSDNNDTRKYMDFGLYLFYFYFLLLRFEILKRYN